MPCQASRSSSGCCTRGERTCTSSPGASAWYVCVSLPDDSAPPPPTDGFLLLLLDEPAIFQPTAEQMIEPVADTLQIPHDRIYANTVLFHDDGSYKFVSEKRAFRSLAC